MKLNRVNPKVQPLMKLSTDQVDLRTLDTNIVVQHLDELIKAREQPLEQHVKKAFRKL